MPRARKSAPPPGCRSRLLVSGRKIVGGGRGRGVEQVAGRADDQPVVHVLRHLARGEREGVELGRIDRRFREDRRHARSTDRARAIDELHRTGTPRSRRYSSRASLAGRTSPSRITLRRMKCGRCFTSSKIFAMYSPTSATADRLTAPKKRIVGRTVVIPDATSSGKEDTADQLQQPGGEGRHEQPHAGRAQHVQRHVAEREDALCSGGAIDVTSEARSCEPARRRRANGASRAEIPRGSHPPPTTASRRVYGW
jgi:hypothetical protein